MHLPRTAIVRILFVIAVLVGAVALIGQQNSPAVSRNKFTKLARKASVKELDYTRPGLVVRILSAGVAADGTVTTRVRFADPKNVPLDKDGISTAGVIAASAVVAYIPKGQTQYVAYTTRLQTSPITGLTATQAGTDSGGVWTKVADGEYTYAFKTKLPASYEKGSTHAVGVYGSRDLTEFDLGISLDDSVYTFVPDNSSKPVTREVVKTESCAKCHVDSFAFHGNTGRVSMEMCILCHTPQTVDPDTNNTVDMPVMIHKIHMGKDLPSVVAGGKYAIVGRNGEVDFSGIGFPTDQRNCQVCHDPTTGVKASKDLTPTQAGCGSCHDNVNFATGENHINLSIKDDKLCAGCHPASSGKEFDPSIAGAHVIPTRSQQLTGIDWSILKVDNGTAGSKPTITFTLKDKAGNPLSPSSFQRLNAVLAGPTTDYTAKFANVTTPGYSVESMLTGTSGANGTYTFTMATAIPKDAQGTFSISLDGRRVETIKGKGNADLSVQYGYKSFVSYFAVDNSPVQPRRDVVSIEKCQACHVSLELHGANRVNNTQHCVVCHNPVQTDSGQRPKDAGVANSIDFRQMIHSIHGGEEIKTFFGTEDYVIYGNGGSKNNFSEVKYPGRLASCSACHLDGTEQLPMAESNSMVANPRGYIDPVSPGAAACLACHRTRDAASHALANTTRLGESCGACHGSGSDAGVKKAHTPPSTPVGSE